MYDTTLESRRDTNVKASSYSKRTQNFVGKIRCIVKAIVNKMVNIL